MLAKKSSRKIVVGGVAYRYKVSRWRRVSDWTPASAGLVDPRWLEQAQKLGLGSVADITFGIAIELWDEPASKTLVTYHAKLIDGFLGPEQLTSITPALLQTLVEQALGAGWQPNRRGDLRFDLVENGDEPTRPALLVLPGLGTDVPDYEPRVVPIRIR
jgi:hypothetical protein